MKLFENLPSTNTPINAENLNQIQDNLVVVSATEPTGDNREKVWMQKGKNLFNKNSGIVTGYALNENGGLNSGSDYFYGADYIKVKPNTTYTITQGFSDAFRICEYNNSKTFIQRIAKSGVLNFTFTTGETTYYLRLSSLITNLDNLQLEQGSTATAYEEYIEPKIYVLNDNDVYEEFISKEDSYTKTKLIWSGDLYETGMDKTVLISEGFEKNKLYLFILQGLSGSFKMTIPYIYGSGNQLQHSYYDGTTVVRWRIVINSTGTGFYLDPDCKNMASNTGIREVYRVD